MIKVFNALLCCTLAVMALATGTAHASTASASAFIENVHYELVDLNLADGITPSVTFFNASQGAAVHYGDRWNSLNDAIEAIGDVSITPPMASISAALGATGMRADASYDVPDRRYLDINSDAHSVTEFTLSPYTGIRFISNGTIDASPPGEGQSNAATLSMSGSFKLYSDDDLVWENQSFEHFYVVFGNQRSHYMEGYLTTDERSRTGRFGLAAYTYLWLSPVPEPASAAMLLGGALLVGAVVRRRAQACAQV